MRPHNFHEDTDGTCELCGLGADDPIHELDGVALGDAEDDSPPAPARYMSLTKERIQP